MNAHSPKPMRSATTIKQIVLPRAIMPYTTYSWSCPINCAGEGHRGGGGSQMLGRDHLQRGR